ncbi:radical SAM protein [Candidatus Collierbacteria bacterium]|nr:radical SAM protein [Candidatus Collierbacteria bacterium]
MPSKSERQQETPFPITTNRADASWIERPAVGPGGKLFYHLKDGKRHWADNLPQITEPVFSSDSFQITAPLKVYFDFTYRCNLECRHCITESSPLVDISTELSTPRILELTSELANIGVLEIAAAGGEPFMHPDWKDIFKQVKSVGMNLIITTNGTLLTPLKAKELKQIDPMEARVSLEGGPSFHDKVRGNGAYSRAMRGLGNLVETGIKSTARLTLCRGANEELPVLFADLTKIGVQTVKVAVVKKAGRAAVESFGELWDYVPDAEAAMWLLSLGKKHDLEVQLSADDFPVSDQDANDPKLRCPERSNCGAGFESCYISPNGEVLGCVTMPDLAFGLLHSESFLSVWQGKLAESYRRLAEAASGRRLCDSLCNPNDKLRGEK